MRNMNVTSLAVCAKANALGALLNDGYLDFFDGRQPSSAETPIDTQILGVSLRFGAPAFRPAIAGVIVSNPIQPGEVITPITVTWARLYQADHKTVILDMSVGTSDANIIVPQTELKRDMMLSCSTVRLCSLKHTPGG